MHRNFLSIVAFGPWIAYKTHFRDFNAFGRASERCERIGGVCTASRGHVLAGSYEFIEGHSLDIRDSPAGA